MTHHSPWIYKDHWQSYLKMGFIPLPAIGKNPLVEWKQYQQDPPCSDEYLNWEDQPANKNIWVLLGDERVVIEAEDLEAEQSAHKLRGLFFQASYKKRERRKENENAAEKRGRGKRGKSNRAERNEFARNSSGET